MSGLLVGNTEIDHGEAGEKLCEYWKKDSRLPNAGLVLRRKAMIDLDPETMADWEAHPDLELASNLDGDGRTCHWRF
jgi:hypothetical protein